jgi:hypothetical protein
MSKNKETAPKMLTLRLATEADTGKPVFYKHCKGGHWDVAESYDPKGQVWQQGNYDVYVLEDAS